MQCLFRRPQATCLDSNEYSSVQLWVRSYPWSFICFLCLLVLRAQWLNRWYNVWTWEWPHWEIRRRKETCGQTSQNILLLSRHACVRDCALRRATEYSPPRYVASLLGYILQYLVDLGSPILDAIPVLNNTAFLCSEWRCASLSVKKSLSLSPLKSLYSQWHGLSCLSNASNLEMLDLWLLPSLNKQNLKEDKYEWLSFVKMKKDYFKKNNFDLILMGSYHLQTQMKVSFVSWMLQCHNRWEKQAPLNSKWHFLKNSRNVIVGF